jgi:hypothetical protein
MRKIAAWVGLFLSITAEVIVFGSLGWVFGGWLPAVARATNKSVQSPKVTGLEQNHEELWRLP